MEMGLKFEDVRIKEREEKYEIKRERKKRK